MLTQGL